MKRIVLDIGHGTNTYPPSKGVHINGDTLSATVGDTVFEEHDFNSKVTVLAIEKLRAYEGLEIILTQQPFSLEVPLEKRIERVGEEHKKAPIDLLISIHANAHYPNSNASGYESYYWMGDTSGKVFCNLWHYAMKNTGMKDRGVKVSSNYKNAWYIVRKSPCSAVLLEHFFYTNYAELMKFTKPEWIEVLADNLVKTITGYFGLKKKEEKAKETLTVSINGVEKEMDFVLKEGRNFVSIREIAESLGAIVEWDNVNKKVMIMKGEN